jgi:hypothetical protein
MQQIRCVIANIKQKILADIIEDMVEECGDIEIVDRVGHINDIQASIAVHPVDLLVLGMKSSDYPQPCLDLMNQIPNLAIVGLVDDGRRLVAFLDNVGKDDILKIVRTLCRIGAR